VTLDENQEISVLEFIRSGFSSDNYVTQLEILSFVAANFGKTVTYSWLSSFLDGSLNKIFQTYEAVTTRTTVRAC
jgi:hypothetical protein